MNSIQALRSQAIQQYEASIVEKRAGQKDAIFARSEKILVELTN